MNLGGAIADRTISCRDLMRDHGEQHGSAFRGRVLLGMWECSDEAKIEREPEKVHKKKLNPSFASPGPRCKVPEEDTYELKCFVCAGRGLP